MKKMLFCLSLICLMMACSQSSPEMNFHDVSKTETLPDDELRQIDARSENEDQVNAMKTHLEQLKIIKTGNITIEVEDFNIARKQLDSLVTKYQGFVANENANKPQQQIQSTITVKLLPEQFYPFLLAIEPLALKVHQKRINTRDVTKQYTDLDARLKAREDIANRYKQILKQAKDINEIMMVEAKLRTVLEDIESMKGEIRYLKEQVGLSTVTVTMYQYLPVADVAEAGFFTKLGHAVAFGWNDIQDFVLGLASSWHLILFWGMIVYFMIRFVKSRAIFKRSVGGI